MTTPHPTDPRQAVEEIVRAFETLTPDSVAQLGRIYSEGARFKDPFNEVQGVGDIKKIFAHMFVALQSPRFVVNARIVDGRQCFLAWEFHFRLRRFDTVSAQCIRGGSQLHLGPDGRILEHRDYWDVAEELYEKLPVLGRLMRWLKKRAHT